MIQELNKLGDLPPLAQAAVALAVTVALILLALGIARLFYPGPPGPPEEEEEEVDDTYQTEADDYDLTIREQFALEFCKAIVQSGEPEDTLHNAVVAVRQANALITALNDPKLRG